MAWVVINKMINFDYDQKQQNRNHSFLTISLSLPWGAKQGWQPCCCFSASVNISWLQQTGLQFMYWLSMAGILKSLFSWQPILAEKLASVTSFMFITMLLLPGMFKYWICCSGLYMQGFMLWHIILGNTCGLQLAGGGMGFFSTIMGVLLWTIRCRMAPALLVQHPYSVYRWSKKYRATTRPIAVQLWMFKGTIPLMLNSFTAPAWISPVFSVWCIIYELSMLVLVLPPLEIMYLTSSRTSLQLYIFYLPCELLIDPAICKLSPLRTKFLLQLKLTDMFPQSEQQPQHFELMLLVIVSPPRGILGGSRIFKNIQKVWV